MFSKGLRNPDHLLHCVLSPVCAISHGCSLRTRVHNRVLPDRMAHSTDCNLIIRLLFLSSLYLYVCHYI